MLWIVVLKLLIVPTALPQLTEDHTVTSTTLKGMSRGSTSWKKTHVWVFLVTLYTVEYIPMLEHYDSQSVNGLSPWVPL
jgi:hypothetical protein